jgi:hypothetical protein
LHTTWKVATVALLCAGFEAQEQGADLFGYCFVQNQAETVYLVPRAMGDTLKNLLGHANE